MPDFLFYSLIALAVVCAIILSKFLFGWVLIREDQVGHVVRKISGRQLPPGRVVALNGEAGYQARTLAPGLHFWYWPWMYRVDKRPMVTIEPGKIGLIVARDGDAQPSNRIIVRKVECNGFQDAEAFLRQGGQKGKQAAVLTTGLYRINLVLFEVLKADVTTVPPDKIGVLTAMDGAPMPKGQMAAPAVEGHNNFQDPDAFVQNGGCRGLQEQIILAGQYNLNPWFVEVKLADLVEVPIGHVGVVVSFVGSDEKDISGETFTHGNIVPRGGKGVVERAAIPGQAPGQYRVHPRGAGADDEYRAELGQRAVGVAQAGRKALDHHGALARRFHVQPGCQPDHQHRGDQGAVGDQPGGLGAEPGEPGAGAFGGQLFPQQRADLHGVGLPVGAFRPSERGARTHRPRDCRI